MRQAINNMKLKDSRTKAEEPWCNHPNETGASKSNFIRKFSSLNWH